MLVGEAVDTLEDFYDPFLRPAGLIQRTPRGRTVTPLAYKHLGIALRTGALFGAAGE
jgi:Holliday junction DNA helicase RuvB